MAGVAQQLLDVLVAGFGQRDGALLLVLLDNRPSIELRHQGVDVCVELGAVLERAGDDQRRARFVDQDRVDFVDDGEVMAALDHLVERYFMLSRR